MEDDTALKARRARKKRRIFSLLFVIACTLTVLIVGTYAWFIGVGVVNVSQFQISIAPAKSLEISLDGEHWYKKDQTLTITRDSVLGNAMGEGVPNAYSGNTNHWADPDVGNNGLSPVSTNGQVDNTVGRLIFYSKTSLTATRGGYRLISSRIDNYSVVSGTTIHDEDDSYVVFDLFLKNGNESNYNPVYNALDNEAIYLTRDSEVTAVTAGSETEDYGLANSVRVAFMQVGRVQTMDTSVANITGIDCATDTVPAGTTNFKDLNTGLCASVTPTIWEPNDKLHNSNLITYFAGVCKTKSVVGTEVTYSSTPCTALTNDTYYTTYVVNEEVENSDKVDIYDGYNGYTVPASYPIVASDTFTDTDKVVEGQDKEEFFSVAPNSITKLRIYIYLEGQDIDNYDYISNEFNIQINFGFTLDMFDPSFSE